MVVLDVVYNHFGPDGNYLPSYACQFFTDRHKTPWGSAINYDGADAKPVREFIIHNALYWLEEFHFDGLRLDAVHAIIDDSDKHVLEELAERVRQRFGKERLVHLILENNSNEARFLKRDENGNPIWYSAQWSDDVHHTLHVAASGEKGGYYEEFANEVSKLGRALAEGFAFQGEPFQYEGGKPRGEPSFHLPTTAFIAFIQNHDQIGNRAFGERLTAIAPPQAVRAVTAVYLLAPQIPMLFMGEEWAAAQPFPFFCEFGAELAEAVRNGRREEFARFPEFQDEEARERIPDPTLEDTFRVAKLAWDDRARAPHKDWLGWHRRVLMTRRSEIVPRLTQAPGHAGEYEIFGDRVFRIGWTLGDNGRLVLHANLSEDDVNGIGPSPGRIVWSEGRVDLEKGKLGPWSIVWSINSAEAA
jgi:malto-oligosyltrehalose trehalohydrolase